MSLDWSKLPAEHVLSKFSAELGSILETTGHNEMYGITLEASKEDVPSPHTTLVILQKFLRANAGDLEKAKAQLTEALKWRKEYNPLAAKTEVFSSDKFGKLGYIVKLKGAKETGNAEDVATFNIYGAAAKDPKKTFGDTAAFIRWRVALMELTISSLELQSATQTIPDYGQPGRDPYQAIQIHDYLSVSFFRQPAEVKASSSSIIELFQKVYPETVSYKYFVNVPLIMQWMMAAMKMLLSKDTVQKMTWMTDGKGLAYYIGPEAPKEYGGSGPGLEETGTTVKYDNSMESEAPTETKTEVPTATTTAADVKSAEEPKSEASNTTSSDEPPVPTPAGA